MRRNATSLMLSSVLIIALAVAAGGCAIRGRATVTPVRAVVLAPQPAVIVTAPAPMPPPAAVVYAQPDAGIVLGPGQVMTGVAVPAAPPPPPARGIVTATSSRTGHVWVRGHYRWAAGQWIWTDGGWLQARDGHVWVQPRYDATRGLWIRGYFTTRAPAVVSTGIVHRRSPPVRASVRIRAGASIQIR